MLKSHLTKGSKNYISQPYKTLYESLWQHKKQRSDAESKHAILKAKSNKKEVLSILPKKITIKIKRNTQFHRKKQNAMQLSDKNNILDHPVIQIQRKKYQRLYEKTGFVQDWLRATNKNIEQKNYECLLKQTKNLQSKLVSLLKKARKAQIKYQRHMRKQLPQEENWRIDYKNTQQWDKANQQSLEYLQSLKYDLEQKHEQLCEQLNFQELEIKCLRNQVIGLLNEKNQLRKIMHQTKDR